MNYFKTLLCFISITTLSVIGCSDNPVGNEKKDSIAIGTYEKTVDLDGKNNAIMRYEIFAGSTIGTGQYKFTTTGNINGLSMTIATEEGTWHDDDAGKNPTTIVFTSEKCQLIDIQTLVLVDETCPSQYVLRARENIIDNGTNTDSDYIRIK